MSFTARKTLCGLLTLLAFSALALVALSALAQSVPPPLKTATNEQLGTFLVGPKGMTLYVFDNDTESGKSTCYKGCAQMWPPFTPASGDPPPVAPLSIITRDDGSKQYAYKGKPLYYYAKDRKAGDTKGHEVGNRWWVVKP